MPGERGSVMVVEDAADSAEFMATLVELEGFTVAICSDAREARERFAAERPVAVLLDWVLPDAPGTEVCREMRAIDPTVPIIFVSGRNDETSVARGLDAGADDYVAKPVRGGELIARLEAHLRRVAAMRAAAGQAGAKPPATKLRFGELELDLEARRVTVGDREVRLGPLEYRLLEFLAGHAGVAMSREQIMSEVYGIEADIGSDRVDLLVRRIRQKLGQAPAAGGLIVSHPGFGYQLERRSSNR